MEGHFNFVTNLIVLLTIFRIISTNTKLQRYLDANNDNSRTPRLVDINFPKNKVILFKMMGK